MQQNGLLIKGVGGLYTVKAADALFVCKARGIFRKEKRTPLPGDRVVIAPDGNGDATITDILPRKNELRRPAAANLDQIFLLASVREPRPNLLVLDKMTALAQHSGIELVLVITKTDLGDPAPLAAVYERAGFAVVRIHPEQAEGVARLRALLPEKISVFAGNSGVGKSTLLNRIDSSLQLATGEISAKLGRGRHTTRHVELYPVMGGHVADTPGFSALELEHTQPIRKEDLPHTFREFQPYLGNCRFTSCSHVKDKGCAILEAVQTGEIPRSRHESYCALYESVKDLREWD